LRSTSRRNPYSHHPGIRIHHFPERSCLGFRTTLKQIKTARIKLDLDLEEIEYRAVELRVSALGSDGQAVCDVAGEVISGHSDEFWLSKEEDEEGVDRLRKLTDISLPLARLRASYTLPHNEPELPESNPLWQEEDTSFSIQLRRKILMRLATSQVLCKIQDYILENPKAGWLWADIESEKRLSLPDIQWDALPDSIVEQKPWADFLKQRDQLCRELRGREARRRVESVDWDNALTDRVRKYARSYRDLLESASSDADALRWIPYARCVANPNPLPWGPREHGRTHLAAASVASVVVRSLRGTS
jgi:hypothetical protein